MATQMSPVCSPETSPKGGLSTSIAPYIPPSVEPGSHHSARLEVKDVQVDKGATMTKQSKRHRMKMKNNRSPEANDLALTWNATEGAMKLSKYVSKYKPLTLSSMCTFICILSGLETT